MGTTGAVEPVVVAEPPGRWRALFRLGTAMLLAMTTWFSASAVIPQLRDLWQLGPGASAWLTIAVQLGFVTGAVASAVLTIADTLPPRRVVLVGAAGAAAANLGLLVADGASTAIPLRFLTGAFLAGVYPPAMKAMATWFRRDRGTALGVMVGALTLGSAVPHLVNALGGLDWRLVIIATSALTLLGGLVAEFGVSDGPFAFPRAPFDPRRIGDVLRHREVRLASFGYFGHMWELYAMWTWVLVFFSDVFAVNGIGAVGRVGADALAPLTAFAVIGIGALGCWVGGVLADRRGRAWLTSVAMVVSGSAAVLIGLVWDRSPVLVVAIGLVWGFWVVADSAQFSTVVTEVADQRYVGTALTMQLALGFTLTVVTIWLVPVLVEALTWRWAFAFLAPGPALGTLAMQRLRTARALRA